MTFANGHKLDSSDVVWSLQNAINNHYVGSDQLGDLKEITNPNANTVVITLVQAESAAAARAGRPCRRRVRCGEQGELRQNGGRIGTVHRVSRDRMRKSCCNATTRIGEAKPPHRK